MTSPTPVAHGMWLRQRLERFRSGGLAAYSGVSARLGDAPSLLALAASFALLALAATEATPPRYMPGVPLYATLPASYFVAFGLAVLGVFLAARPGTRLLAATCSALVTVLPLVLLLPHGHLHDSNRNLLIAMETLAGRRTGMYHDAFPGFWALVGLAATWTGANPWALLRWFPVVATLGYATLTALLAKGLLRAMGVPEAERFAATGAAVFFLLTIGPLVWVRNNLAPESYGFAVGLVLVYLAARGERHLVFFLLFLACAGALIVSHPLSPVLIAPGVLAAWGAREDRLRASVGAALRSATRPLMLAVVVLYAAWILYPASWIVPHAQGIFAEAFNEGKQVTSVNRLIPGSEGVRVLNFAFLGTLALAFGWLYYRARRSAAGRLTALWAVFMAPILVATVGGKFFSRPLLFLLVPAALVVGASLARLPSRSWARLAIVLLLVATAVLGASRAGYVEAVDRPTGDEIAAYAFAYGSGEPVYRPSMGVHFFENGLRLHAGSPLQGGGRAYDSMQASCFPVRIVTEQSLAYGALLLKNDWPVTPEGIATKGRVSLVYANGLAVVAVGAVEANVVRSGFCDTLNLGP